MKKEVQTSTINMTVLNDDDFLSPYSETSTPMISSEVADFLENSANVFHPKDKLQLNVYTNCVDEVEQQLYPNAIKNYYTAQLKSLELELKRNLAVVILFTIIGICGLTFLILYSHFGKNEVWAECIDIFAWVFLWEAVDQMFIQRSILLRKRKRLHEFCQMTVNFLPLKQN